MKKNIGRIIGIDFGEKRIGLAISDPTNTIASSLPTIEHDKNTLKKLQEIIFENDVAIIVIGYPLNMDGTKSKLCFVVDKFIEDLEKNFSVKIVKRDERLTSIIAQKQIIESVKSKSKRRNKSIVDQFSARIILQEYLNEIS